MFFVITSGQVQEDPPEVDGGFHSFDNAKAAAPHSGAVILDGTTGTTWYRLRGEWVREENT